MVMPKTISSEYGHMHLSIFYRKVLRVGTTGLLFKSKHYPWSAIRTIKVWQQPWPGYGYVPDAKMLPRAKIFLSNGKSILLRGDVLVKRGQPLTQGFSDAFDELMSYLHKMMQREQMNGTTGGNQNSAFSAKST